MPKKLWFLGIFYHFVHKIIHFFSNWIFKKCALNCVVHHFVSKIIHFAISFFQALEENGIWSLVIRKVGHDDAGIYECQTNSEIKGSVTVVLDIEGLLCLCYSSELQLQIYEFLIFDEFFNQSARISYFLTNFLINLTKFCIQKTDLKLVEINNCKRSV